MADSRNNPSRKRIKAVKTGASTNMGWKLLNNPNVKKLIKRRIRYPGKLSITPI
jgi:hypothetical protein